MTLRSWITSTSLCCLITSAAHAQVYQLGQGLPGYSGVPEFTVKVNGGGAIIPDAILDLQLANARPSSSGTLVIGQSLIYYAILGGILVPSPDIVLTVSTDGNGRVTVPVQWPNIQHDSPLYAQFLVDDIAAAQGQAFSNALGLRTFEALLVDVQIRIDELIGNSALRVDSAEGLIWMTETLNQASQETIDIIDSYVTHLGSQGVTLAQYSDLSYLVANHPMSQAEMETLLGDLGSVSSAVPPAWLLDLLAGAGLYASGPVAGGVLIYVTFIAHYAKLGAVQNATCAERWRAYLNLMKYNCEALYTPACAFSVTGGPEFWALWCTCPQGSERNQNPALPASVTVPWKSNPGDFADPYGKTISQGALCASN